MWFWVKVQAWIRDEPTFGYKYRGSLNVQYKLWAENHVSTHTGLYRAVQHKKGM